MKVAISFFNSIIGGPREVTKNLLKFIPDVDESIEYVVFTDSEDELEFLKERKNVKIVLIKKFGKYDLLLWEQIMVLFYSYKEKIDLFHGTKNSIPLLGSFKKICTIHDIAYYIMPDTFSLLQRFHLKLSAYIAKYFSHKIVAVSHNTKKDINEIIKVNNDKIDVIYNSIDSALYNDVAEEDLLKVKESLSLPDTFFLHVGTLQPRKNIATIVDAFIEFKKDDAKECYLVLAGRKGWYFDEISEYIKTSGVQEYVIFTGPVSSDELIALYHLSYLFIYASNYDGFGLVPLEAMATGTPTICSNISSLPEVVGDAAIGVSPKSAKDMTDGMTLLVGNSDEYERYSKIGVAQAKKFSWEKSAQEYVELYKKVIK